MPQKFTEEFVNAEVINRGYVLLTQYFNSSTKMTLRCACENEFQVSWNNFNGRQSGCPDCSTVKRANGRTNPYEVVEQAFVDRDWQILSPEKYKNNSSKLDVMCDKGHETTKTYSDFQQGKGCWVCKSNDASERYRLPVKKAHAIAKKARLRLLSEDYTNMRVDVLFECIECNFQFTTWLDSVKSKGTGCPRCKCSQGERFLMNYFEKHEIGNKREKKFKDCKDIRPLPFDAYFVLDDIERVIEIDGIQHFKPVGMFGGDDALDRNYRIDTKKSLYCYNNGMSLLRISYLDLENLDDIMDDFISQSKKKTTMYYSNTEDYSKLITLIDDASKKQWVQ